jgi:hypothetical protein
LAEGRKALKEYTRFTGLPFPPEIKEIELPGPRHKKTVLVGMGRSPEVQLADGPEGSEKSKRRLKGKRMAAVTADGKRIVILSGRHSRDSRSRLRYVGRAPETHYIPTPGEEKAGTFKRKKYWVHLHGRKEDGIWPKVYQDQAGNFVYERGGNQKRSGKATYTVKKWIER